MRNCAEHIGWLDRSGKLHKCKFYDHARKALRLLKKHKVKRDIESAGWICLREQVEVFFLPDIFIMKPTHEQIRFLNKNGYELCGYCTNGLNSREVV